MRNPFFFILFICSTGFSFAQSAATHKTFMILPQSELMISGDTNISGFSCNFNARMLPTNCAVTYRRNGEAIAFSNAVLVLNNRGFDCGNKQINKDFHDLLQTEEYPSIELELKKISPGSANSPLAQVIISIAGEKRVYEVPVKVLANPETCFSGILKLDINDFGLQPPKKAFGLIKVKEEIKINFNLTVAE